MTEKLLTAHEVLAKRIDQRDQYRLLKAEAYGALEKIITNIAECEREIKDLELLCGSLGKSNG